MRCDTRRLAAVLAGAALFVGCKLKTDASSASQVLTIPDGTPLDQSSGYGEWGFAKEYAFEFNVLGDAQGASSLGLDDTKPLLSQGDMVIDEDQTLGLRGGLYLGVAETSRTWPNAELVYSVDDSFLFPDLLQQAMAAWTQAAGVTFRQAGVGDTAYVKVTSDQEGCFSSVGYRGKVQTLNLGSRCGKLGTAVHELGHALGLHHEQARSDRDSFVSIHYENIIDQNAHNFDVAGATLGDYDYDSIMHYGEYYFTKNGQATIEPLTEGARIGNRDHLSSGDIAAMKTLYPTDRSVSTPAPTSYETPVAPTKTVAASNDVKAWCQEAGGKAATIQSGWFDCDCGSMLYREDAMRLEGHATFVTNCRQSKGG